MIKKISIGLLLGSLALTQMWANQPNSADFSEKEKPQFVISEESFNLIKTALIKVLKENKELKEEVKALRAGIERNAENIMILASYSKEKVKEMRIQSNTDFERFKADQISVFQETKKELKKEIQSTFDYRESAEKVIEHFKNNIEVPLKATFVRDSHTREGAGIKNKSLKIYKAGKEAEIIGLENDNGSYWYQISDGSFTHFKNLKPIFEKNIEVVSTPKETAMNESNNAAQEAQTKEVDSKVKEQASKMVEEMKKEQNQKSEIELEMEKAQKILDNKGNGGNQ